MSRRTTAAAALGAGLLLTGCFTHDYETKPRVAAVDGDPIVQMTEPGRFPSIVHPRFVPYRKHNDPPFRNERVLGLSLGSPARMFPIGLLDTYEVVNGEGGAVPFVVARCPLTDLTAVFDRRVAGRTLTFENSGALWRDMLVLRDQETGTLWTPATGRALAGPLAGETLIAIPAPVTTADAWEELEPATACMETGEMTAVPLTMRAYASSGWEGVSGGKIEDRRYPPKERMFFVAAGGEALAFTGAQIRERRSVASELDGLPITIEWDAALRCPRAYRLIVAARQELPVVPMFWFAVVRHFATVRTLPASKP